MTITDVIRTMQNKGYVIDKQPFKLNIVGIRNSSPINQDSFDDKIALFYYDKNGKLYSRIAQATTDPSTYFLKSPIADKGTAILKSGQYLNSYKIGLHKGQYEALVQSSPVTVFRDSDRDGYTNFGNVTENGLYGINIHRATIDKSNKAYIGKDSAGCQVFQNVTDFNEMMRLAKNSRELYGNSFNYTLLDERDTVRFRNTALIVGAVIIGGLLGSYYLYNKLK